VARQESVARLGATISVRFDPEIADRLRAAGRRLGVPYASLVRRFVEERLAELEGQPLPERFHRRLVLDVEVSPATGEVTIVPGAA
jgi:predicted DNA-binding protein